MDQKQVNEFYRNVMEGVCVNLTNGLITSRGWSQEIVESKVERFKQLWKEKLALRDSLPPLNPPTEEESEPRQLKRRKLTNAPLSYIDPRNVTLVSPYEYPLVYDDARLQSTPSSQQITHQASITAVTLAQDDAKSSGTSESSVVSVTSSEALEQEDDDDEEEYIPRDDESELGSEDDSLEDEIPECDNSMVTQYVDISHKKNKWMLKLMNGMMHVDGKDYVFHKFNGNFEW